MTTSVLANHFLNSLDVAKFPGRISSKRATSLKTFGEIGLPNRRAEEWKYTDLGFLNEHNLKPAPVMAVAGVQHDLLSIPAPRVVLFNGHFDQSLSDLGPPLKGLKIRSLREAFEDRGAAIEDLFYSYKGPADGPRLLSQAAMSDGVFIEIGDDVSVEDTIHIVNISRAGEGSPLLISPGIGVVLGKRSRASIIEIYGQNASSFYWLNSRTAISLGEASKLQHVKIQNDARTACHVGGCEVTQAEGSHYDSFIFSAGAKVARNELRVALMGAEASAIMNGLYLAREGQHHDCFTIVDHVAGRARSSQYYKGILSERSRAVFNGKIIVRRDSQQTDSSQLNRNLLLGPGAEIDTRPQLQIDADDVKCNHGASIGRINAEELFYLESRGLSREQAGHLLCIGFAEDIIQKVQDKRARHEIQNILSEVFAQMKVVAV